MKPLFYAFTNKQTINVRCRLLRAGVDTHNIYFWTLLFSVFKLTIQHFFMAIYSLKIYTAATEFNSKIDRAAVCLTDGPHI